MTTFIPKSIEGFESGLPLEIRNYLHLYHIHHNLFGPNANLGSSWRGVEQEHAFSKMDESYTARQHKKRVLC